MDKQGPCIPTSAKAKSTLCNIFSLHLCLLASQQRQTFISHEGASAEFVNTVSFVHLPVLFLYTCMMHKEFCNSYFYSGLSREIAWGRLCLSRTTQLFTITFFLISCFSISLSAYGFDFGTVLTSVKDVVLWF
jgi:hypothetical protein